MEKEKLKIEQGISDLVGALCDPLIVYPGGWEDTVPDWLKQNVALERLVECAASYKGGDPTGTDAEAVIYLYTACLCFPFDHDWTQIYLYLGRKVYERLRTPDSGVLFPDDIKVEELTRQQEEDLRRLKNFIYNARIKARQEKDRAVRREVREEVAAAAEAKSKSQLYFNFFEEE